MIKFKTVDEIKQHLEAVARIFAGDVEGCSEDHLLVSTPAGIERQLNKICGESGKMFYLHAELSTGIGFTIECVVVNPQTREIISYLTRNN